MTAHHPEAEAPALRPIANALGRVLEGLGCDDLRRLPERSSLTPVAGLLLRFPELAAGEAPGSGLLPAVLLSILLHPDRSVGLQDRLARALEGERLEAVTAGLRAELDPGCGRSYRLEEQLEAARSAGHRLVLLLYWLLRHGEARDFRYDGLPACGVPGEERALARGDHERRHLVPLARVGQLYGLENGRPETHPANDLGNLTWVSKALHDPATGLGDLPADLENEPVSNRARHFVNDNALLDLYQRLVDGEAGREDFERFCALRRRRIARGFERWLEVLWRGAGVRP